MTQLSETEASEPRKATIAPNRTVVSNTLPVSSTVSSDIAQVPPNRIISVLRREPILSATMPQSGVNAKLESELTASATPICTLEKPWSYRNTTR